MKSVPIKPTISYQDLEKVDIRVGTIEKVEDIPYANGIIPVLAMPEKLVLAGVSAG